MNAITRNSLLVAGITGILALAACKSDDTMDNTGAMPQPAPPTQTVPPPTDGTMPAPTNPTDTTPPPVTTPPTPPNPPTNP
jgi:hypothetical protein